jgi:hypothetical protein
MEEVVREKVPPKGRNECNGQSEQNGAWGACNPEILQGRGRVDHKNALPIGSDPLGLFKITFFLEKI